MTAAIVPFPLVRRGKFITRQASRAAELSGSAADKYILYQIKVQGDVMRRKGIDEDLITRELLGMASAIRATLWDAAITSGAP